MGSLALGAYGPQGARRGQNKVARRVPRGVLGLEKLSPHSADQISALGLGASRGEENAENSYKNIAFSRFQPMHLTLGNIASNHQPAAKTELLGVFCGVFWA